MFRKQFRFSRQLLSIVLQLALKYEMIPYIPEGSGLRENFQAPQSFGIEAKLGWSRCSHSRANGKASFLSRHICLDLVVTQLGSESNSSASW